MNIGCDGRVFRALGLMLGLAVLAGCGSGSSASKTSVGATFTNPVYTFDFPDPNVLKDGTGYFAFATNGNSKNIQELKSKDLVHWTEFGDAMPIAPSWADSNYWAPTVVHASSGKYVMYFAGHDTSSGKECIGQAIAPSATGPFIDKEKKPLICQLASGGSIDPDVFRDTSGTLYLYWKNDGNCCGIPTYLWGQRLAPDALSLIGKPVKLMYNDQSWEGDVTEAPSMVKHAGAYFLFFSGAHWDSSQYAVGYAACKGPLGPCTDAKENPILSYRFGTCKAEGPGGQSITTDKQGQTWLIYHAWQGDATGYGSIGGKRVLWLDRLDWKNGKPTVHGSTCKAQSGPVVKS